MWYWYQGASYWYIQNIGNHLISHWNRNPRWYIKKHLFAYVIQLLITACLQKSALEIETDFFLKNHIPAHCSLTVDVGCGPQRDGSHGNHEAQEDENDVAWGKGHAHVETTHDHYACAKSPFTPHPVYINKTWFYVFHKGALSNTSV